MDREADIRKIVAGGRGRGLSDDQIRALVTRYDSRMQPRETPLPEAATREMLPNSTASNRDIPALLESNEVMGAPLAPPVGQAFNMARAVPGVIASAANTGKSALGRGAAMVGNALEKPLVSGSIGAAEGYRRDGIGGAALGFITGGPVGNILGRTMSAMGRRMTAPRPNSGGTVTPRSTPTVNESIEDALNSMRAPQSSTVTPGIVHRTPTSVRLPDQSPGPSVTMSPKSQAAASGRVAPPRGKSGSALGGDVEQMYRELASKPILSPQEQQVFERLHAIVTAKASHVGRSYAAGGAP